MANHVKEDFKPNRLLEVLAPSDAESLHPEPGELLQRSVINLDIIRGLAFRNVIEVNQFSRQEVVELCKLASILEAVDIGPYNPLEDLIVITAFFEASTRTRTSFESAVLRLDGKIISIPDGQITGAKKGESLEDIGEMFNAYGDLVIMRHTETDAPERLMQNLRIPLINAGNGTGEHPTQAMADWYALLKWRPELAVNNPRKTEDLHLGVLGTPGSMRAVKSFVLMSLKFQEHLRKITFVSEMADPFGEVLKQEVEAAGIDYEITNDMNPTLPDMDIIYMNSIVHVGDDYKNMDRMFKLDKNSPLKEDAVILHPLARLAELDTSLDDTSHNLYWSQAHGAVFIRQALLTSVMGRYGRLPENLPIK
ncbi:MAG: aspartate carbamoyltransferase [Verrucomicrobiota bacterium]